jgi:hypothetical protein
MTWAGDKKEILVKVGLLYAEIQSAANRYDASLALLNQMDFFAVKLVGEDPVITEMLNLDKEWFEMYLTQMSDLMGEEK